jgi:hypothetical protein
MHGKQNIKKKEVREVYCRWNIWKNLSFLDEFLIAVDFGGYLSIVQLR